VVDGAVLLRWRVACQRQADALTERDWSIADALDLSTSAVKSLIHRARQELRARVAHRQADVHGLAGLVRRVGPEPPQAVIESMTGARFVHDRLEELGWDVRIADAAKVKGIGPLAAKSDKIDARVLAVLSQRDLIPEIWLPSLEVRQERELARFRLHLVKHKSMLKHRIHSTLISFGKPCPVTDLFGVAGRNMLADLKIPEPWRSTLEASVAAIDHLEAQIDTSNKQLRAMRPDHKYVPTLMTAPGIGWVLAFTIAAEIGEVERFDSADRLVGYTGLCPRVIQSGDSDRRGPLAAGSCSSPVSRSAEAQASTGLSLVEGRVSPPPPGVRR
jgi:transposase